MEDKAANSVAAEMAAFAALLDPDYVDDGE
jgi:hypothetical protein